MWTRSSINVVPQAKSNVNYKHGVPLTDPGHICEVNVSSFKFFPLKCPHPQINSLKTFTPTLERLSLGIYLINWLCYALVRASYPLSTYNPPLLCSRLSFVSLPSPFGTPSLHRTPKPALHTYTALLGGPTTSSPTWRGRSFVWSPEEPQRHSCSSDALGHWDIGAHSRFVGSFVGTPWWGLSSLAE